MPQAKYSRVLLKLSGEFLSRTGGYGVDPATVDQVAEQIRLALEYDVQLAIVIAAAISGAVATPWPWAWNEPRPTIWACWVR
jgi:hypothetical protein